MTRHFTPETENVEFYDVAKKIFDRSNQQFEQTELLQGMEKIYQKSCMASRFSCLIKLNQHIFILSRIVTKNYYFFCPNNLIVYR